MIDNGRELYFAYGSNMSSRRLLARLPSAKPLGQAHLEDYSWSCNKLGRDGTAKANLIPNQGATVIGALFSIDACDWEWLDRYEPDYSRIGVEVQYLDSWVSAQTYLSTVITNLPPSREYLCHIIDGMREHQLPLDYIESVRHKAGIEG